ncbi:MAG: [FeFe] hydrogenase H-cluster radical SAM maturase HydG [Patescibacteria group bacterium]|jgi:2-iminoacetate synthase
MTIENIKDIVDDELFNKLLLGTIDPTQEIILKILKKASKKKGLSLEDVAALCNCTDPVLIAKIFEFAYKIKQDIYGERIVLFAPLYISDFCVNDCEYCNFHCRNNSPRRKLSLEEVASQTKALVDMGHKRLLLEFGEHPVENPIDYVVDTINTIYKTKSKNGEIRRVNVNIAATTVENYRKLKEAGIGTYQLFQETYHRPTFEKLHHGPKAKYERQLFAHNKAFEAGIDDLGIGVLYGLYDWRYEVLALVSHAAYMDKTFGVGPHTISVPRFQETPGVDFKPPYPVSEDELLKIVAILRLAVPYTGMIISTRERPEIREQAFKLGISQTSAGSRVEVGGYDENSKPVTKSPKDDGCGQFTTHDPRTLDQIVISLCDQGLLPSFCTACYRSLRTGESFMEIAKPGNIHNFCRPNGILTFKEYLLDYASPLAKQKGEKLIREYLDKIPSKKRREETMERLARLEKGERDLYF